MFGLKTKTYLIRNKILSDVKEISNFKVPLIVLWRIKSMFRSTEKNPILRPTKKLMEII
jgi:hypothetical protein